MPAPFVLSSDLVSAYPAKSVTLADYIDTSLAAKTDTAMVQNAQTGSSYSYALADASKLLTMSNASANTVLVTKQATVTWVTGTQLRVMNLGAGVTTLVADTGVTINGNVALKQYQGGELIRTASDVWLFVPTASSSGMDLITPASVAGSGVSFSGGQISFSAATSISANGVFTSAYQNYLILHDLTGASASNPELTARLRLAGSDAATNYATIRVYSAGATVVAATMGSTGLFVGAGDTASPSLSGGQFTLIRPALAVATIMNAEANQVASAGTHYLNRMSGYHSTATAYDGLTLVVSSGNVTGSLRIYGLRSA